MKTIYSAIHQPKILKFLLLAILVTLIGSSTAVYGQDVFTDFEFTDTSGEFVLGTSPKSVTFTGGLSQTVGQPPLYFSGTHSFMVTQGNTATISFETPAASVTLWLRDQSNTSVLRVFDQRSQLISTINATTSFVRVSLPECGFVGSITLQNNGTGFAVIDDFSFTAGQVTSGQSTVLVANFLNGNTDFFRSRIYLFNPSAIDGIVCGRLFTLPRTDGLPPLELTEDTSLFQRTLAARSALNLRLEEILDDLSILRPHVRDNGNLTLELTIGAPNVKGAAQVFNNSQTLAFGTYPLQAVPSTSAGSPTVLVANFLNGNTDFFRSRIYLFNPSASDGAVTVRVFTLPRTDDPAEELANGPVGTLAARSALNLRLEEILDVLSIPRPHVIDNGNVTLEFTIGAADVIGAAQVFNNSLTLAFGTYPLQDPPDPGAGESTSNPNPDPGPDPGPEPYTE